MLGQSAQQETGQGREAEVSWQKQKGRSLGALGISASGAFILHHQQPRAKVVQGRTLHPRKTTGTPVGYTMNKSHRGVKGLGGPGSGEKLHACYLCVELTQEAISMEERNYNRQKVEEIPLE